MIFFKKNHNIVILSNHYLKMTDAIVPGEIFSCFSPTRA